MEGGETALERERRRDEANAKFTHTRPEDWLWLCLQIAFVVTDFSQLAAAQGAGSHSLKVLETEFACASEAAATLAAFAKAASANAARDVHTAVAELKSGDGIGMVSPQKINAVTAAADARRAASVVQTAAEAAASAVDEAETAIARLVLENQRSGAYAEIGRVLVAAAESMAECANLLTPHLCELAMEVGKVCSATQTPLPEAAIEAVVTARVASLGVAVASMRQVVTDKALRLSIPLLQDRLDDWQPYEGELPLVVAEAQKHPGGAAGADCGGEHPPRSYTDFMFCASGATATAPEAQTRKAVAHLSSTDTRLLDMGVLRCLQQVHRTALARPPPTRREKEKSLLCTVIAVFVQESRLEEDGRSRLLELVCKLANFIYSDGTPDLLVMALLPQLARQWDIHRRYIHITGDDPEVFASGRGRTVSLELSTSRLATRQNLEDIFAAGRANCAVRREEALLVVFMIHCL